MAKPFMPLNATPIIQGAIMKALHESAPIFKSRVVASVSGVLRDTGKLASSIYAKVTKRQGGGALAVGTAVVYGLFWEYGFLRGGKAVRGLVRGKARKHRGRSAVEKARLIEGGAKLYRRTWFRPVVEVEAREVKWRIEAAVNDALKQYQGSVDIDIKIF